MNPLEGYKRLVRRLVDVSGLVTLGHYSLVPLAALCVLMRVALVATGGSYAAAYAVGALMLPFMLGMIAHGSSICTRGRCAVLMSAQPSAEAQRQRWWLHHMHHQLRSALSWGLVVAFLVITFVIVNPILSAVPAVALLVVEVRAITIHSRLRPWCPYCHGRGKDDEGPADPPPPGGRELDKPREVVTLGASQR